MGSSGVCSRQGEFAVRNWEWSIGAFENRINEFEYERWDGGGRRSWRDAAA